MDTDMVVEELVINEPVAAPESSGRIKAQFFVWPDERDDKHVYGFHCTAVDMQAVQMFHVVLTRLMTEVSQAVTIDIPAPPSQQS